MSPSAMAGARAVVMGGSVGGLTAGLLLRDLGCDVRIYERSSRALEGRGAGIVVHEATVRYLVDNAGFDLDRLTARSDVVRFLRPDGSLEYEEALRYRLIGWNTLYRSLLQVFDDGRYHLDSEVIAFRQTGQRVELELADGRTDSADLLVCADGISSTARARLLPGVHPTYAGYVAWRGVVAESVLTPATQAVLGGAITYQVLKHSHILVYPIPGIDGAVEPGRRLMNFVWYRNVAAGRELDSLLTGRDGAARTWSVPPGQVAEDHIAELRQVAGRDLAPPIAEAVLATAAPFVQVIVDVEVPQMAFDRIVLLGDAAYCARPHTAAGTAKACADAWALAEALGAPGSTIAGAGRAWQTRQLEVGRRLVERARAIGERSQVHDTFLPGDPSLRFGLYAPGD